MTQAVPGGQHTHPDWCVWNSNPQAVPIPLPAFLPSTAAENSWILPQDAPSECENSSSARSHSNCSLATRPHLLFSSQCSCVWPPCAAHEAVAAAASPGPQTHPASPSRLHPFDCFTLGDRRDPHPVSPCVTLQGLSWEGLFLVLRSSILCCHKVPIHGGPPEAVIHCDQRAAGLCLSPTAHL